MDERRVVITGLGPVTPIGVGATAFHEAQLAGVSGVGPLRRFDATGLPVRIAAEVGLDPAEALGRAERRRHDRVAALGLAAAALAVEDAGLEDAFAGAGDRSRWGAAVGTALGGIESLEQAGERARQRGPGRVDPFLLPKMIGNAVSAQVAMRYGLRGPMLSPSTACATGTDALGEAFRAVQRGEAEVMLAGGAEAPLTPLLLGALSAMGALSHRNDEPACASRPFDRERDGFVLGEGAAVLVLESLAHAERRGARIHAELLGYGRSADAYHVTQPDPRGGGAALAMRRALDEARLDPGDVDHVNAHATSTPLGDAAEATAIGLVFGDHALDLLVSATKSMTGHLIAASGAAEAIAAVQALVSGVAPPTINHACPDEGFHLDVVANAPRQAPLRRALSNSFGFGGNNAAVVFARL
ncbi:MAG: beta-ketoacyl-ACP synthase II [Deinococcales bacterium]